jgi:hypothetical protein
MPDSALYSCYLEKCSIKSDINEHLPTLFAYTQKCDSVTECGVRDIVSSYAFASGLLDRPNKYTLVDPYKSEQIEPFLELCKAEGINATFMNESDIKCERAETDLLFIDTWHVYGQLKRELNYWHSYAKKYIIMHDTTVDEWLGESIRNGQNTAEESKCYDIPEEEIRKGLWPAVAEFLEEHPEWEIDQRYTNNNGLTILIRLD